MRSGNALRIALGLFAAALFSLAPSAARADGDAPAALFQKGADALTRGEYGAAIDAFEALADSGFMHPDASYDRGLAYVLRVRAKADRPGDLGRAAAGFEEALLLRPSDADADAALDLVRAEVTRRRSRRAKDAIDVRPTLDRVIVGLVSEEAWEIAAISASVLLVLGLALRRSRPSGAVHVAGSVLAPSAALAMLVMTPIAWGAHELAMTTHAGVVVAQEAFFTNESGASLGGAAIPEAASVEVGEHRGALAHVRWGATEGWIPSSAVRVLAGP